jgi:hypothetical protein
MAFRPDKSDSDQSKQRKPSGRKAPWGGRPRVSDPKDKFASIRFAGADYDKAAEAAERAGLSFGAFVRKTVVGAAGPRAKRCASVNKALFVKALADLGKAGSNLNQLAKVANTTGRPAGQGELAAMKSAVDEIKAAILKALGYGD